MKFPLAIYQVKGHSMEPTLYSGQRVVISRLGKGRPGNLVIFKKNAQTMVKRIEKIEGDHVMVRGDHPDSTDSRSFGSVRRSQILGKVLF